MKLIEIKTTDIKPYEKNAKKHDVRQIENVAESMRQFGIVQPLVVDADNVLVIGHCRLAAAKVLGIESVPCVKAEELTEEQIAKLRILDNKLNESEWDIELLREEIETLQFDGFDVTFDELNIEDIDEAENVVEVPIPEAPETPITKAGDIWELGEHRLVCGDSTNPADVEKLTEGMFVDAAITDPPYNVDIGITDIKEAKRLKRRTDGLTIENDKMSDTDFYNFLSKAFVNLREALKPGGVFYIWHASMQVLPFWTALEDNGLEIRQQLIWIKSSLVMGRQDYQWIHEPCLYGWRDGAAHYFIHDRSQTTAFDPGEIDIDKLKKEEMRELLHRIYDMPTTIIREDRPTASKYHPTMKPVPLIARQVANSTRKGETVLDLFGGSGSTLLACEQLGRKCRIMEYDPHYCDVIIKRWEEFTGEQARRL